MWGFTSHLPEQIKNNDTDLMITGNNKRKATCMACASPRALCVIAALACLPIGGCAVGPDYKKPDAPAVSEYTAQPPSTTVAVPNVEGGQAQRFASGADISGDWWTVFHSKPLDDLIAESISSNHTLKAAQAALTVARENTLAQRGNYYPKLTAGFSATRNQDPQSALAPIPSNNAAVYNLFTPQLSISYVPDVFGLNQRTVESLAAQEQGVRYQLAAAHITLSTNVVATAIQIGSLETQVEATRELIAINTDMLKVVQYQFTRGYASKLDLAAQQTQLAQTNAALPALIKQLAQQRDLLAVLVGRFPSQAPADKFTFADLQLPQDLPLSLPSVLVEQRPDVLQAEANMHAANAQIGVAIANRLPNITLSADAGSTALQIGELFGPGTGFWNIGSTLAATIFDGNTLLHQERAARAAYIEAAEQYRGTVQTAFQNVADTLVALQQDAEGLKAAASTLDAAKVTLDLSQRQYKDGYANYLSLLSAQQAYQQARITLVQAQASRYADTAALFQALGGGWWHRTDLARNDHDE
jgi:NodT family efflux transporter outer membrane factor (OMF) lipoprotein